MPAYLYFILLSLFASFFVFAWKNVSGFYKLFPLFLLITFTLEYFGWKKGLTGEHNTELYNLLAGFEFLFYMTFFVVILQPFFKLWVLSLVPILYFLGYSVNILFFQGFHIFNTYTFVPGCAMVIILGLVYFFALFRYTTSVKLSNEPSFWIVSALLFYYICFLPSFGIVNYLISENSSQLSTLMTSVTDIINYLLYILFTIAFLCKSNIRKYL